MATTFVSAPSLFTGWEPMRQRDEDRRRQLIEKRRLASLARQRELAEIEAELGRLWEDAEHADRNADLARDRWVKAQLGKVAAGIWRQIERLEMRERALRQELERMAS